MVGGRIKRLGLVELREHRRGGFNGKRGRKEGKKKRWGEEKEKKKLERAKALH